MNRLLLILAAVTVSRCAPCPAGIVADTIWHEARGESEAGQYAVASVIWNRHLSTHKTVEAICLQPKQFSCHNAGYRKPLPRNQRERELLIRFEAWEALMIQNRFVPSGVWNHYHALSVNPAWSRGMTHKTVIGNHLFGVCK